ncbi:MAG: type II toxin-antitoxin system MqsR family toxin [Treponema sp.]|nr:type II toxin-antitoxin system MqsR family toxin [Treponema sp.]
MNNIIAAQLFIKRLKALLDNHKERISFDPRNQKTQLFMMQEGMNTDDVFAYLEKLEPSNYFDGPKEDHNGTPGYVMMFLYPYKKTRIYIKLKIWENIDGDSGVVISFHEEGEYD